MKNIKDISKAKVIYERFAGSKFQMQREDELNEYEKFDVSKETESKWLAEILEKEFIRFNVGEIETAFPLWYIIETHGQIEHFDKLIDRIVGNVDLLENQFIIIRYAELIFNMLKNLSQNHKLSKELKLKAIGSSERIMKVAQETEIPSGYLMKNFEEISDGLTQKQYVNRRIANLRNDLQTSMILK